MSVQLEIEDGNPWWLSPNLWTVPGNDPQGSVGAPISGRPCYVWTKVNNNGRMAVEDATVYFYWANPSIGFDRNSANFIGTANVSLNPGESQDVLCLTPWIPVYVNNGHECILAEAFHSILDPLPTAPAFNVASDRHVAQRNISVVMTAFNGIFNFLFEIHNNSRKERNFKILAQQGNLTETLERLPWIKEIYKIPSIESKVRQMEFTQDRCSCDSTTFSNESFIELKIAAYAREGLTLRGIIEEGASLIHIQQIFDGKILGGLSTIVISRGGKN